MPLVKGGPPQEHGEAPEQHHRFRGLAVGKVRHSFREREEGLSHAYGRGSGSQPG